MAEIILTKVAVRDLNSIYDFIAQGSAYYAQLLIERIFRRIEILSDFPKSGRIIPEFEDELFRELIEGNYRIFYKIKTPQKISIIRIHHSAKMIRRRKSS